MTDNLHLRLILVRKAIEMLEATSDPRKDEALAYYKAQAAEIEKAVDEAEDRLSVVEKELNKFATPGIVIALKPGIVSVKGEKYG
jgi:hypothetical protein